MENVTFAFVLFGCAVVVFLIFWFPLYSLWELLFGLPRTIVDVRRDGKKAIEAHHCHLAELEERKRLKEIRMQMVEWSNDLEIAFQGLLKDELFGSIDESGRAKLDSLTLARQMNKKDL